MQQPQQTALVIGSGMAGLAAAAVLSKHFRSVAVLERDEPEGLMQQTSLDTARMESSRPGVQQVSLWWLRMHHALPSSARECMLAARVVVCMWRA